MMSSFALDLPIPHLDNALTWVYVFGFAAMLAVIDVIEQVMSNAAIEKIDPLGRKCNTNNSLLAIWIANMGSSFFGGMTNLDGLAKSTTNKLAGAMTKFSVLGNRARCHVLRHEFAIPGVPAQVFAGGDHDFLRLENDHGAVACGPPWAICHDTCHVCGLLVYKVGIFEGLLIAMAVHGLINYIVFNQAGKIPGKVIIKKYFEKFSSNGGAD